jgi:hydrogenase expression/formation protein HypC
MCLAIPGKVVSLQSAEPPFASAIVEFGGIRREVSVACLPEAIQGDYVLVHAGVAISRVDPDEAARVLESLRQLGVDDESSSLADVQPFGDGGSQDQR